MKKALKNESFFLCLNEKRTLLEGASCDMLYSLPQAGKTKGRHSKASQLKYSGLGKRFL